MIKYQLSESVLKEIDESQRLIFKMGGVNRPRILIHQRVLDILLALNVDCFDAFRVDNYELGAEF